MHGVEVGDHLRHLVVAGAEIFDLPSNGERRHLLVECLELLVPFPSPLGTLPDNGLELLLQFGDDVGTLFLLLTRQLFELLRGENLIVPHGGKDEAGRSVEQGDPPLLCLLPQRPEGRLVALLDLFVNGLPTSPKALCLEGCRDCRPQLIDQLRNIALEHSSFSRG